MSCNDVYYNEANNIIKRKLLVYNEHCDNKDEEDSDDWGLQKFKNFIQKKGGTHQASAWGLDRKHPKDF